MNEAILPRLQPQIAIPQIAITLWQLRFVTIVAVCLVITGIWFNATFYSEVGQGSSAFGYAFMGILLDLTKIIVLGAFVKFSIDTERYLTEIILCISTWSVLSLLSLAAAYGFLSQVNEKYESEKLKASAVYAQHESAIKNATQEVQRLAQHSGINAPIVQAKIDQFRIELSGLETKLAECPKNYFTHCINPTQAKINAIETQLTTLRSQIMGFNSYQRAMAQKKVALDEFAALDGVGTAQYHPLFVNVGGLTNAEPRSIKSAFILLTSLVVELLGSILFYLRARLTVQNITYTVHAAQTSHAQSSQNILSNTHQISVQPVNTGVHRNNTQSVATIQTPQTSQPTQSIIPVQASQNTQSSNDDDLYKRLKQMVSGKELKNLSFQTIRQALGVNNKIAGLFRDRLVTDGYAIYDDTKKCLPTK